MRAECTGTLIALTATLLLSEAAAQAEPGLILHWPLAGDFTDASGRGRHGQPHGPVGFAAAPGGTALALPGDGAWVAVDTTLSELGNEFTVECRVNPESLQVAYADILGNHVNQFAGFVLQQDGDRTNQYYFSYGTGTRWVYSPTFTLAADTWQHVHVTKGADRLRVYVDGVLIGGIAVEDPMAPSDASFMVGLGIEGQPRWFRGQVADVRIWDHARPPLADAPPERQLELFAANARVEWQTEPRWAVFAQGEGTLALSVDAETVPVAVQGIRVELAAADAHGNPVDHDQPHLLTPNNGFCSEVAAIRAPGLYRVALQPYALLAGGEHTLPEDQIAYLVMSGAPRTDVALPAGEGAGSEEPGPIVSLDGDDWLIAIDPAGEGIAGNWYEGPIQEAQGCRVPWIIQGTFPGYHGLAWYWRAFETPPSPFIDGRALLRFEAVDYKADVWVNGRHVGGHEGAEGPFELDVTDQIRPSGQNLLAVRVLNPTHEPIDGITLNESPRRAKVIPYSAGASYNHGGIVGEVKLAQVPQVHIEDLHLMPDPDTGVVGIEVTVRNASGAQQAVRMPVSVAPAEGGPTVARGALRQDLGPGVHVLRGALAVPQHRLWDLSDPFLYRVTARVESEAGVDERADRCGFRDFRFEGGAFRLNGRRIFLRGTHTVNATPLGQQVPGDPALFQRDLILLKTMGINCIRFIWGGATRRQLDMCDEIGMLVYVEHAASNPMVDGPHMKERFDASVSQVIRRDRNHASVVIWGLLNETPDGPVFHHATQSLPLVRSLDESRMVMLNSGRWDGCMDIGSISNPYSTGWDGHLGGEGPNAPRSSGTTVGGYWADAGDAHAYPRVPHDAATIAFLRGLGGDTGPVFLSEYGIGSAVDLWRVTRQFERLGDDEAEDAVYYAERLQRFLADWERWNLEATFATPRDFFAQSLRKMAGQRTLGLNALRANPNLVGYSVTGMMDHVNCGEGLFTLFRELKPGTTDAMADGFAPLRLCLFAEPANVYRGGTIELEAVLANEDALAPGSYPVRLQIVGPHGACVLDETVSVEVPEGEAPLALPFYARTVPAEWPEGRYRFLATLLKGGAPTGGEAVFRVYDPAALPRIAGPITLCGGDAALRGWLASRGVEIREFADEALLGREAILVAGPPTPDGSPEGWAALEQRIASGGRAVFVAAEALSLEGESLHWLPLAQKGTLKSIHGWLYLKDEWAMDCWLFDGLPAGGLLDYGTYRDVIPDLLFDGQEPAAEVLAGAIKASQEYDSGLMAATYRCGDGEFLLSTLRVIENLGRDPIADRILLNALAWVSRR
ncbi:MAG: hypothetical protein KBA64_08090 [Armatimonadetes bacterium]|jgi:hypothetical protein|nr:hypothetical protein [Armatimonadota bacterium]